MTVAMKSSTFHPYTSTNEKFFCTRRRQIKDLSDRKNREKEVTKSIHICSSYRKYAKKSAIEFDINVWLGFTELFLDWCYCKKFNKINS